MTKNLYQVSPKDSLSYCAGSERLVFILNFYYHTMTVRRESTFNNLVDLKSLNLPVEEEEAYALRCIYTQACRDISQLPA